MEHVIGAVLIAFFIGAGVVAVIGEIKRRKKG